MKNFVYYNLTVTFNISILILAVHAGSKTTQRAKQTLVIISQMVKKSSLSDSQKIDFNFFIAQSQMRDVNLQNVFFNINWNTFVNVISQKLQLKNQHQLKLYILDYVNYCYLLGDFMSIWFYMNPKMSP